MESDMQYRQKVEGRMWDAIAEHVGDDDAMQALGPGSWMQDQHAPNVIAAAIVVATAEIVSKLDDMIIENAAR